MKDLFEREERILCAARDYLESVPEDGFCSREEYEGLVNEYYKILKLVRRQTKVTDQTATELNADKLELLDKVQYDALTGIHNRRFLDEEMNKAVEECRKQNTVLGVLMMDVDFFKQYNDTYGHECGDECLRRIAQCIEKTLDGGKGFSARYGGEEFIAVLPNLDQIQLERMGEKIIKNIMKLQIAHKKNEHRGIVTISIGGTSGRVTDGKMAADYVRFADTALYKSKQTGRNRYVYCELGEE